MKRSTAFLLALVIVLALVANSADFFFHTPFYETWDSAANALSVDRAKHFAQLYGPYSRWGFYHPGPALFYIQALGEWLFYDLLRLTPAPYNAQTLLYVCVSVGFFVAALRVFSRWLAAGRERWWFLCAALGVAILHFTAVNRLHSYDPVLGPNVFFGLWSAHALVLPFLCLLAAGASVAAGKGEDLPLLALADGFLLQTHVAQPLFVLPLTFLALAGLIWRCAREQRDRIRYTPSRVERLTLRLGAGWRAFPRAHGLAAAILAFFALPVLIDLCWGTGSNLAAILHHLRTHHDEHKSFAKSLAYFLQFGAYTPYQPGTIEFGTFDRAGMNAYLRAHWLILGGWLAVLLGGLWALSGAVRRPEASPEEAYTDWALRGLRPARQRFAAWAAVFGLAAMALTLKWGVNQDGRMFYYNSWFNFAIYYFGVLIVLAAGCRWVFILRGMGGQRGGDVAGAVGAARWPCCWSARCWRWQLRVRDADPRVHPGVPTGACSSPWRPRPRRAAGRRRRGCCTSRWRCGVTVVGAALEMERAHQPFYVPDGWEVTFGHEHAWKAARAGADPAARVAVVALRVPAGSHAGRRLRPGRVHRHADPRPPSVGAWATTCSRALKIPVIDPTLPTGAKLEYSRRATRPWSSGPAGWGDTEADGTWTDGHQAVVQFQARAGACRNRGRGDGLRAGGAFRRSGQASRPAAARAVRRRAVGRGTRPQADQRSADAAGARRTLEPRGGGCRGEGHAATGVAGRRFAVGGAGHPAERRLPACWAST